MAAEHHIVTLAGDVTDLFGHRFVLATSTGKVLADLGPKGAQAVNLSVGEQVTIAGERKPSEIKVHSLSRGGRDFVVRSAEEDGSIDDTASAVVAAVGAAGFEPVGEPRRKPKHVEIIGRRNDELTEFHVGFGGDIRKSTPVPSQKKA